MGQQNTATKVITTDAEAYFDQVVNERRHAGRKTYGTGLEHRDSKYDWNRMALEEALDLAQYLCAQNRRLEERLAAVQVAMTSDVVYPVAVDAAKALADARRTATTPRGRTGTPNGKSIKKPCPVTGVLNSYRRFSYLMPEVRTPENLAKYKGATKRAESKS